MDNLEIKVIPAYVGSLRPDWATGVTVSKICKRDRGRADVIVICEFFLDLLAESGILSQSLEYLGLSMCYLA